MSLSVTVIGSAILTVLLGGYLGQKYLPAPVPRIAGIDLGTTYSSIGFYHAVSGKTEIIEDEKGRKTTPSVVGFISNGTVLVGYEAVALSEHNPLGTIYDAKRFIGKTFTEEEFAKETARYSFKTILQQNGSVVFSIPCDACKGGIRLLKPEHIGSYIIGYLKGLAEDSLKVKINRAVISVPAEFDEDQRAATTRAAHGAGLEVLRIINEPTAAALSYGLHKKQGIDHVLIVDLGGGTMDVSLLLIQGGVFITMAMAGNNHLGGQDFNQRVFTYFLDHINSKYGVNLSDFEDLQNVRLAVEAAKLELTYRTFSEVALHLHSIPNIGTAQNFSLTREQFEALNSDLFAKVLKPIDAALRDVDVPHEDVHEIVLVGGSTRIPRVQSLISEHFGGKSLNAEVDPELAVVTGVAVQSGIVGGGWPLQVTATELPTKLKKIHVYD